MHVDIDESIFREYDIRGIWGQNINEQFCIGLGRAFALYLKNKIKKNGLKISVGYDARLSSKNIFKALCNGLNCEGVDVVDLGLVPTPVQYFSLFNLDVDGGIMITASHNPKEYNGFKLSVEKETLYGDSIQDVKNVLKNFDTKRKCSDNQGGIESYNILKDYENYMLNQFGYLKDIENKPKIVLDAGNGVGGVVGMPIMQKLGFDVKGIFIEPDGSFPNHHPDPTVEKNLGDLKKELKNDAYTVGIGYDGDADRIGAVLKNGDMLYGDQLLLLFAQDVIKKHGDAKIIGEVKCSDVLFEGIRKAGGEPIMYKAGHSLIKSKMKLEKALLAGEMSGHIFFADRYFGYDDAVYASLRLLEILTRDKIDLIKWKNSLPKTFNTPEIRINFPDDKKKKVIGKLIDYFEDNKELFYINKINTIDGIRFNTDYGWGLVRASNTQPSLVLRFEAVNEKRLMELKNKTIEVVEKFRT